MPITNAADEVDQHDEQAGDGVAAHDLRRAVHCAAEAGFVLQILAPPPCLFLVDEPGIEVGVDRRQNLPGISLPWR
jgi:hypothetical protein